MRGSGWQARVNPATRGSSRADFTSILGYHSNLPAYLRLANRLNPKNWSRSSGDWFHCLAISDALGIEVRRSLRGPKQAESVVGGPGRNRTDVRGFAVPCMATLPPGRKGCAGVLTGAGALWKAAEIYRQLRPAARACAKLALILAPHSAAAATAGSTLAAQNLNSGILPNGSSAGLVSRFAAASAKQNGMNTMPCGTSRSLRSLQLDRAAPRDHAHELAGPDAQPPEILRRHAAPPPPARYRPAPLARRVMAPVCQCSSRRPVESTIG